MIWDSELVVDVVTCYGGLSFEPVGYRVKSEGERECEILKLLIGAPGLEEPFTCLYRAIFCFGLSFFCFCVILPQIIKWECKAHISSI